MVEKSRIGIVGCGDHQRRALMPQLATVEQAELVACADIDEVAAVTASNQFGFQRPYIDYRDMLDRRRAGWRHDYDASPLAQEYRD